MDEKAEVVSLKQFSVEQKTMLLQGLGYQTDGIVVLDEKGKVEYIGLDIKPGTNVDLVVKDPYKWTEIEDNTYDLVISGQAFEHIEFFWLVFEEMVRVLKPNGYMCLIVPKYHIQHRYPVDCWRFLPDGMRALAKYAGIKCLKAEADHVGNYLHLQENNGDCVGVFQKYIQDFSVSEISNKDCVKSFQKHIRDFPQPKTPNDDCVGVFQK